MDDLTKVQFDYAWKWFDLHAKQRTTVFNYFMIITGILAAALVTAYKEGYTPVMWAIGLLGFATAVAFIFFDIRNRNLVALAEAVLEKLERDHLFPRATGVASEGQSGLVLVERSTGMREGQRRGFIANLQKHKWWIRGLEGLIGLCFLASPFLPRHTPAAPNTDPVVDQLRRIEALLEGVPRRSDLESIKDQLRPLEDSARGSINGTDLRPLQEQAARGEAALRELVKKVDQMVKRLDALAPPQESAKAKQ